MENQNPQKYDWKKYLEAHPGQAFLLPDQFLKVAQKNEKTRVDFNERLNDVAKQEVELSVATQNLFLEIRNHLYNNGVKDIFSKEVGFDQNALREGVFIINIVGK